MLDLESLKNSIIYSTINNMAPDVALCMSLIGCPQAAKIKSGMHTCKNCLGDMLYTANFSKIEPNITLDNFVATMTLAIALK